MTIFFDMDGTLADFYSVDGWLEDLINRKVRPYEIAKPLFDLSFLETQIHRLQDNGVKIGIISWLSKESTAEFDNRIKKVKIDWLHKYLPSVWFDELHIVEYGTPKDTFLKEQNDILFDDELRNRAEWTGIAHDVKNILEVLQNIG